jgi:hypothetical protein
MHRRVDGHRFVGRFAVDVEDGELGDRALRDWIDLDAGYRAERGAIVKTRGGEEPVDDGLLGRTATRGQQKRNGSQQS